MSEIKHTPPSPKQQGVAMNNGLEEARKKVAYSGMPERAQRAFDLGWEMRGESNADLLDEALASLQELVDTLNKNTRSHLAVKAASPMGRAQAVLQKAAGGGDE